MFEHLGPTPEVMINKKTTKYSLYVSLLVFSVFLFMFSMGVSRGPSSQAKVAEELAAKVFVDPSDKKIVDTAKNFSMFDFVVDVNKPETSLYILNILVEGVYDIDVIRDLKLFHEGVQLGGISKIDNNGKIYFNLADYELDIGKNKFSLFFANGDSLKAGSALKFSIENNSDIFLITNRHVFKAQTDFPISGGLVSIVDEGQVSASNSNLVNDFLVSSDIPQQVSAFELSAVSEQLDLKQIVLSYDSLQTENQSDLNFVLVHDNRLMSEAISSDGQIIFDLSENIVLNDLAREKFYLYAIGLPEDTYQFFISDVLTQGVLSGVDILLVDEVALSNAEAKDYFIQFRPGDLDKKLSKGWNKLYSLNIKTIGEGKTYLNKVTWQVDAYNLDIDSVEVLKDGESYIADIILKDNRLIIKTDGANPLEIGQDYTELLILANITNIKANAKVETFVLADKESTDEEAISGNVIWSDGDNFYNGHKIPYLPLEPSILAN